MGDIVQHVTNPWAAYVAMVCAMAFTILSITNKAHKSVFYVLSGLCAFFGLGITYTQNNTAKIEADRDIQINKELTELRVSNGSCQNQFNLVSSEKEKCLQKDSQSVQELEKLKEANRELKSEKKELERDLKKLKDQQPKWVGGKSYKGVFPAEGQYDKWGYIDKRGNNVYPYVLKSACQIHFDRGGAQNTDGKWGFIDSNGYVQVPFKYDDAKHFEKTKDGEVARVLENGEWYYINKYDKKVRKITNSETAGL